MLSPSMLEYKINILQVVDLEHIVWKFSRFIGYGYIYDDSLINN